MGVAACGGCDWEGDEVSRSDYRSRRAVLLAAIKACSELLERFSRELQELEAMK